MLNSESVKALQIATLASTPDVNARLAGKALSGKTLQSLRHSEPSAMTSSRFAPVCCSLVFIGEGYSRRHLCDVPNSSNFKDPKLEIIFRSVVGFYTPRI